MHVLITGGTGFIGRALIARLASSHQITVHTRSASRHRDLNSRVRLIESLDSIDDTVDAVINLAGANLAQRRWSATRKQELIDSRVHTTVELIDWMRILDRRPEVFLSGSAIGWYGTHRGDTALTECDAPGTDFPAQLCRQWEAQAQRATELGVRTCIVRTGIVLGPNGGALAKMLLPFKLGLGGPIASGHQWMSWVALPDIVRLFEWLMETSATQGVYNGTAPTPVRNESFAQALGRAVHPPAMMRVPAVALKVALGEMAELLIDGQRVMPDRALREGFSFQIPDLSDALAQAIA